MAYRIALTVFWGLLLLAGCGFSQATLLDPDVSGGTFAVGMMRGAEDLRGYAGGLIFSHDGTTDIALTLGKFTEPAKANTWGVSIGYSFRSKTPRKDGAFLTPTLGYSMVSSDDQGNKLGAYTLGAYAGLNLFAGESAIVQPSIGLFASNHSGVEASSKSVELGFTVAVRTNEHDLIALAANLSTTSADWDTEDVISFQIGYVLGNPKK